MCPGPIIVGMGAIARMAERLGIIARESAPDTGGQPMATITPGARATAAVSDELALSLDAVYRAVSILETAAGQLTVDVWRDGAQITPPAWVAQPDPWRPTSAWMKDVIGSLALRGNAYIRVDRNAADVPVRLEVLDPADVTVTVTAAGIPTYRVAGIPGALGRRDVAHLALMRRPGRRNIMGMGPIQAAAATITGAAQLRRSADEWQSGTVPNGVLTSDQVLTSEMAQNLKTRFVESVRADEPVVLGAGTAYKPLLLTPQELQFLESQAANVTAISRLFGIPARLMLATVDGSSATYSNQQQEDLSFLRWTLMGYLREIEAAITWLLPRGNEARFNLDGIQRPDITTRYAAHAQGLAAGFLTVAEVRATEGLPPLTTTPGGTDAQA